MPVRSLHSSVFKWPNEQDVDRAIRQWAAEIGQHHTDIRQIGYTGSYARGDWGVGSDLDVLIVVDESHQPFMQRALAWDTSALPIPTDVMVYTQREWVAMARQNSRFYREAASQAVWVYERPQDLPAPCTVEKPADLS